MQCGGRSSPESCPLRPPVDPPRDCVRRSFRGLAWGTPHCTLFWRGEHGERAWRIGRPASSFCKQKVMTAITVPSQLQLRQVERAESNYTRIELNSIQWPRLPFAKPAVKLYDRKCATFANHKPTISHEQSIFESLKPPDPSRQAIPS